MIDAEGLRIALATFLAILLFNGAAAAETALEMREHCRAIAQEVKLEPDTSFTMPDTYGNGFCWGGFSAVQGFRAMAFTGETDTVLALCIPPGVTRKQIIEVFYTHAQAHPESLHEEWHYVAFLALREAFPCP